jgi:hypothetical protein
MTTSVILRPGPRGLAWLRPARHSFGAEPFDYDQKLMALRLQHHGALPPGSGLQSKVPRPWPERQNEEDRNAFLEKLQGWQADLNIELWFADVCGV